jgi:hypothetical protein
MEDFNKDALLKEIKGLVSDNLKGLITETQLNEKMAEINKQLETLNSKEDNHKEVKDLSEQVEKLITALEEQTVAQKAQGNELKALRELGIKAKNEKPMTFREALKDAFLSQKDKILKEVSDDYGERLSMKEFIDSGSPSPKMVVKAAVDMLESNISGNYVDHLRLTELDPMRVGIPLTVYPHVFDWMQSKNISKPYMALLVVGTYVDGSGTKTEGAAPSQSSFLLTTTSFKAFYNATYFTISDETFDDLDEVLDEIAATAPDKILSSIDGKILSTAGDDSSDIKGMYAAGKMTAFATATYTDTVESATVVDLIDKSKLQCLANGYRPNVVVMNPLDVSNLGALRDLNENSVQDRRVQWDSIGNPVFICGLRIINTDAQTADTLSVLDNKLPWIGKRKDMSMEIGYNGTDLTEGQKTVVIKVRNAFGVRDNAGIIYSSGIEAAVVLINIAGA